MEILRKQVSFNSNDMFDNMNNVISSIERLFDNYYEIPVEEKLNLLKIFYLFAVEENETLNAEEMIREFDRTHSLLDVYNDIKSYLAILLYYFNRNAANQYEEETSMKLLFYYNTTFKQKRKTLE